jgi:hypothetical protein
MRNLCLLGLWCASLAAEPITFEFFGTWYNDLKPGKIAGVEIAAGDPFSGSFTFNRDQDGAVSGEFTFALGELVFHPAWLVEYPEGWGSLAAITPEAACKSPWGDEYLQCRISLAFTSQRNTGCGGLGTGCHSASIWVHDASRLWSTGLTWSRDVEISPFLPFRIYDSYVIPEPATILLVGLGLLLTLRANRPAVIAARLLAVGAVAGAVAVLVAVWRLI